MATTNKFSSEQDSRISLVTAPIDKWALLEKMLQLYAYDFSEFTKDDINECGDYGFGRLLRYYWNGKNPDPFIVKVDDKIAGFVMVKIIEIDGTERHSITEFFILRKYRKSGIGKKVVQMILKKFPGNWYVDVIQSNEPACLFWEKVIGDHTEGKYRRSIDKQHEKVVFFFENK